MLLFSGEDHSPERRAAFNIALSHFNIAIREAPQPPAGAATADTQQQWNVSEGHRLSRFSDGMKIPSRGPLTSNRAAVLLAAYGAWDGCVCVCVEWMCCGCWCGGWALLEEWRSGLCALAAATPCATSYTSRKPNVFTMCCSPSLPCVHWLCCCRRGTLPPKKTGAEHDKAQATAAAAQEASRRAAIAAGLIPEAAAETSEEAEAARVRRLKAQGRFMPY